MAAMIFGKCFLMRWVAEWLKALQPPSAVRIEKLESNQDRHASVINLLAEEIDNLKMLPPEPPRKRIGFNADDEGEGK